ncbi:somatostatin receptor type 4 [Elysia marginata]|uniref:Somatostatin receptor type 4 n=1 Tax=Elysia marginata TaxID=1093978 RepID=A0AAV4HCJ4_9GAST|nr:somatostatin receptor type 4 [Elysia marginata]
MTQLKNVLTSRHYDRMATVFLSSACSFTSVWLIVFVSHENFVRIARAHQVKTVCTRRRALINIALLYIIAAVIYNCHLWTSRVLLDAEGQDPMCMALSSRRRGENTASKINNEGRYHAVPNTNNNKNKTEKRRPRAGPHGMLEMKVARFLTIVTLTLIILSTPSHALRLKMVITSYITASKGEAATKEDDENGAPLPSTLDATLQRAFEVVYYLSFSGNLFIFLAAGHNFRRIFLQQMRAHTLRVCLFLRRVGCLDEPHEEAETPNVPEVGQEEDNEEVPCERSVQSSGSKSDKLFRKQSFSQRCISWLKSEESRRERGGFGRDAEISRGAFTSLELLASSCIEMENLGLDLANTDRDGSGGGEDAGSSDLKNIEGQDGTEVQGANEATATAQDDQKLSVP